MNEMNKVRKIWGKHQRLKFQWSNEGEEVMTINMKKNTRKDEKKQRWSKVRKLTTKKSNEEG